MTEQNQRSRIKYILKHKMFISTLNCNAKLFNTTGKTKRANDIFKIAITFGHTR